jgi:hypothetical protein
VTLRAQSKQPTYVKVAANEPPTFSEGGDEVDLRTYLTALNANLQGYLREGISLNGTGLRLDNGGALFLLLFGSESEHQLIQVSEDKWSLDRATRTLAEKLEGKELAERVEKFNKDVMTAEGRSPAVLIADNGMLFYRPAIDEKESTYNVSAVDALSIARSVA